MAIVSAIGEAVGNAGRAVSSMVAGKALSDSKQTRQGPPGMREPKRWNLRDLPPEGHPDVGPYFYQLYEDGLKEKQRLGVPEKFLTNYQLFRGYHWQMSITQLMSLKAKARLSIGLLHANITRTVANITARAPVAEVESSDGIEDGADRVLSEKMRLWNAKEEQQLSLSKSVLNSEIYGITVEKAVYDHDARQGRSIPLDPFGFVPAPGYYERLNDAPYLCHLWPDNIENISAKYGVEGVIEDEDIFSVLGEERQEQYVRHGTRDGSANFPSNYVPTHHPNNAKNIAIKRGLVIEIWVRDYSTEIRTAYQEATDPVTGETIVYETETEVPKYPGGIRVVTITNKGHVVCADQKNPNVNHALPMSVLEKTYLFKNFPFFKANSYEDTSSVWGYSMAETVGDINLEIDRLWSGITNYLQMAMYPPLILPQDTKVHKSQIRYLPRLVIQPSSGVAAQSIRWLDMPTPPSWMFEALNALIGFFDRISQIEDADRGQAPGSVIAASAIQMLQERGAVLVRAKIRAVDYLIRERGRCFISFYQNFGTQPELVEMPTGPVQIAGMQLIQREFNYIVESGSTVARTSSQIKQEAVELYKLQAIDRRALLQQVNFPDWKKIVERMGESQLQAALQVLVQAGLPEDMARSLYNFLIQDQGGPGDATRANAPGGGIGQAGAPAEAGTPKAEQGQKSEGSK